MDSKCACACAISSRASKLEGLGIKSGNDRPIKEEERGDKGWGVYGQKIHILHYCLNEIFMADEYDSEGRIPLQASKLWKQSCKRRK